MQAVSARTLGEIGDTKAINSLIMKLKDPKGVIRSIAAMALKNATGEDFGKDHIKWQKWQKEKIAQFQNKSNKNA